MDDFRNQTTVEKEDQWHEMKSSMKSRKYSNGFLPPELYQSHFNSCWSDNLSKRSPQSLYCTFPMKKRPKIFFHFVLRISLLFWNSWQVWPLWAIGRRGKQLRSRNSRLQLQPHQAGKLKFQILEKMKWAQISKYWKQLREPVKNYLADFVRLGGGGNPPGR